MFSLTSKIRNAEIGTMKQFSGALLFGKVYISKHFQGIEVQTLLRCNCKFETRVFKIGYCVKPHSFFPGDHKLGSNSLMTKFHKEVLGLANDARQESQVSLILRRNVFQK